VRDRLGFIKRIASGDLQRMEWRDYTERYLVHGTLNPYLPKRVITSTQIYEWVEEPVDQKTVEDANQYK
jgi:hypothetical protein